MSLFLLDSTVLIAHLRGDADVVNRLVELLDKGNDLTTSAVNIAEVESGLRAREAKKAEALLDALGFLPTDLAAARFAGLYQRSLRVDGITLHTADALIAGTARRYGAILMTHNTRDFPMGDIEVISPN